MPRQREIMSSPYDASRCELRRRFLDSLAYICDHEKGGDSMTAVFASSPPLVYHLACNKRLPESNEVVPFVVSVLEQLGRVMDSNLDSEQDLLARCVQFSEKRVETYRKSLQKAFDDCLESVTNDDLRKSEYPCISESHVWSLTRYDLELLVMYAALAKSFGSHADLCRACFAMIKSNDLSLVIEAAKQKEDHGNARNHFANFRHFVGRLGTHVQVVKILVAAAKRFPTLFQDFHVEIANGPISPTLAAPPRKKLTLDGIANRMVANDDELKKDVQGFLKLLDQRLIVGLEERIRERYGEKGLKPRVHAELILLEHYYRNRESLQFYENDRYIGASKPACYCCYLYFREHPADPVQPATHQKIYLNWLPPTSTPENEDPNSETLVHERTMLNAMVRYIRKRTIDQLKQKTGGQRRQHHFDSVTWDSFPITLQTSSHNNVGPIRAPAMSIPLYTHTSSRLRTIVSDTGGKSAAASTAADLADIFDEKLKAGLSEADETDDDGGVALIPRQRITIQ